MSNRRQRFVFGVIAALVGAVAFLVASAYIVFRGLPTWLAAVVGAFAFPVGPLAWQLLGERKRKKKLAAAKTPSKSTLTGGDRYWMRFVVVLAIVLGPMIAIGRFDVARAVWRNGLWFVPTHYEPAVSHGGPLSLIGAGVPRTIDVTATPIARVPSDAELVVVYQSTPGDKDRDGMAAAGYGDRNLVLASEGKVQRAETPETIVARINNEAKSKLPWLPLDKLELVSSSDTDMLAATAGWRASVIVPGTGPNADVMRELGRAPRNAILSAAFVPRISRDVLSTKAGAAWLYKSGDKLAFEGRVEAIDEAAAKRLVDEATRALDDATHDAPDSCRDQVAALVRSIQLDQQGAVVTGRVVVDGGTLLGVGLCVMKSKQPSSGRDTWR